MNREIILDTETTGLNPSQGDLLEVAVFHSLEFRVEVLDATQECGAVVFAALCLRCLVGAFPG